MTEYMDMSDPAVQQMLDDDRAEALARIRAAVDDAFCTSDDPWDHQGDTCPVHEDRAHWALLDSVGVTAEQREEILKRARPSYRSNNK